MRSTAIFDVEVTLREPVRRYRHSPSFLRLIGVNDLHYRAFHDLNADTLLTLAAKVPVRDGALKDLYPMMIFAYSDEPDGCSDRIDLERVHGISLLADQDGLRHLYFERTSAEWFEAVPAFTVAVSRLSFDDVRSLHFATRGSFRLPQRSTIYELRSRELATLRLERQDNRRLRIALASDQSRYWGLPTVGLYGTEVYTSLMVPTEPGGEARCGNIDSCPYGTSGCNTIDPIGGYMCDPSDDPPPPDDGCVAVADAIRKAKEPVPDRVDFATFRTLFDSLLSRCSRGHDYISGYFVGSQFLRRDPRSVTLYIRALPHFNRAMRALALGPDDAIVVTPELEHVVIRVLDRHRELEEPALQPVLDMIERDLRDFVNVRRGDLLAAIDAPQPLVRSDD